MTAINPWLKEIAEDETYWSLERKEAFPSPLVFEYLYLRELAGQEQLYGMILQSRDLFEALIKYPCVMGLIAVMNRDELRGTPVYQDLVSRTLKDPMTMGSWYELAGKMVRKRKELGLPDSLVRVLRETRAVFHKKITSEYPNIINWRNTTIGHGALRFQDDPSYREEILSIIGLLKVFFSDDHGYEDVYIRFGTRKMTGERTLLEEGPGEPELVMEGRVYPVSNYMLTHDLKCFFFNSFYREKKIIRYSSYMVGQEYTEEDHYFGRLYDQYALKESGQAGAQSSVVTRRDEKILECLTQPGRYIVPKGIPERVRTEMNALGRGVIAVHMERGTGKTALAGRMNGLYHGDVLIDGCFCRTYHLSRIAIRGVSDFINSINSSFMYSRDSDDDIWSYESELPSLRTDADDRAGQMAEFLNAYHEIRGCEYTILILDGIDELDETAGSVIDFIPSRDRLEEGVFVWLFSRMAEERTVTDRSKRMIEEADERADRVLSFPRTDPAFVRAMKAYIHDEISAPADADELIRKADYRFLYLKLYAAVRDPSVLNSRDETAFVRSFYDHLLSVYGPAQRKLMREISAGIALFPTISLSEYRKHLNLYELTYPLIGTLNDLMPLLTVTRRDGEDRYEFADAAYREYVLEHFSDEVYAVTEVFEQSAESFLEIYKFVSSVPDRTDGHVVDERKDLYFYGRNGISLWKLSNRFAAEGRKELVSGWALDLCRAMEEDPWIRSGYGTVLMDGLADCAMETLRDGIYRAAEGKDYGEMTDCILEEMYGVGGGIISSGLEDRIGQSDLREFVLEHLAQLRDPEWLFWLIAEDFDESELPLIRDAGVVSEFAEYYIVFEGGYDLIPLLRPEEMTERVRCREESMKAQRRYEAPQPAPRELIRKAAENIRTMDLDKEPWDGDPPFDDDSDHELVFAILHEKFRVEEYADELRELYRIYYERMCCEKETGKLSEFISATWLFNDLHEELMKSLFGEAWIDELLKTADEIWNSSDSPEIWHANLMQSVLVDVTKEYLDRNRPEKAAEVAEKLISKYDMPIFLWKFGRSDKVKGESADLFYCTDNALALLQLKAACGTDVDELNRRMIQAVHTADRFEKWLPEFWDIQTYRFLRLQRSLGFADTVEDVVRKIVGGHRRWIEDFLNDLSLESNVPMLIYHMEILLEYYKQMLLWEEGIACCEDLKDRILAGQNMHPHLPSGFLSEAAGFAEEYVVRFEMKKNGEDPKESDYLTHMKEFLTGWSDAELEIRFRVYPYPYDTKYMSL